MKLETFFEKFEVLAEMPGAVGKLRELILRSAMLGRLSEPNRTDGSVDQLLQEVEQDKARIGLERSVKPGTANSEFLDEEIADEIPVRWTWVRFGNIARHNAGKTLDTGRNRGQLRDYITTSNLYWGFFQLDAVRQMPIADEELERCTAVKGDLLICEGGEAGRAAVWPHHHEIAFQNHIHRARLFAGINPFFVQRYFEKLNLTSEIEKYRKGVGISNMSGKALASIPIPLPTVAEQSRIVAKLDELMALCDRLEAQQQERETRRTALARASLAQFSDAPTPANLQFLFHTSHAVTPAELRKAILTLAIQGKLVAQDPNDEPANETLEKVLHDRERQEKSLRIKEPSPVEAHPDHTPELPSGWCFASPDQLTAFHKNALTIGPFGSSLLKSDYAEEGVPLVFVRDIRSESFGGPETRFVTPDKAEELASHTVRPGDLLVTKMGDPPGDTAIYSVGRPPAIITADCIKLTPHPDVVTAEYLRFTIRASQIAEQFAGITLGVAQQKVSLGRFRCIAVPLPPLAEQRRIVAKVEQLMGLVDALESKLAAACATAQNILAGLTRELGSGPLLVPAGTAVNYYRQA